MADELSRAVDDRLSKTLNTIDDRLAELQAAQIPIQAYRGNVVYNNLRYNSSQDSVNLGYFYADGFVEVVLSREGVNPFAAKFGLKSTDDTLGIMINALNERLSNLRHSTIAPVNPNRHILKNDELDPQAVEHHAIYDRRSDQTYVFLALTK